ncbi:hypothetical protein WM11_21725 [Burkholderia ubonensis]|nr:hypothetical protein WM10_17635 [Burkholderia ubonensis]KWI99230.1 hypothetical protein WM11_21725 [Burkholderia ubonensis]KWK03276.1 hypothetical protein WM12_28010 [Burkholderia ubonensis]KWK44241.1 hypothetical protein WM14_11845 [Burkholderia ubonensis]KWK46307.1 hypothetical protein WM13_06415 [Burkholderia ubonensis]
MIRRHIRSTIAVAASFLAGSAFFAPVRAAQPNECQMKSAYVEFVAANRQRGLPESAIPDLYGTKLDGVWKQSARGRIYSDANLALSDPMRLGEQVYRECQAANQANAARYHGTFTMPPKN